MKGGSHLETLGRLSIIAIDKTGTLTEGRFRLVHFLSTDPGGEFSRETVLSLAAGAENLSSHPLAAAIVKTARGEGLTVPSDVKDYDTIKGEGLEAIVSGRKVQVGNRRMADKHGWIQPPTAADSGGGMLAAADEWEGEANTVCWVAIDGKLAAVIGVADKIRDEAKEAITLMKKQGVRIVMLTGDNEGTARAVQKQLGLDEVKAKLLPSEKVDCISTLKLECPEGFTVGMVGDGINDAPALSRADVGIAMGAGGTAAAMETADVALMDSSLMKLAMAQKLGVDCLNKIRQNVVLSFVSKIVMIVLAACGYAPLWLAIVADVGAMLIVCINGMSLLDNSDTEDKKDKDEHEHHGCCFHGHSHGHSDAHGHSHGGVACDGDHGGDVETVTRGHAHGHAGGAADEDDHHHAHGHDADGNCCEGGHGHGAVSHGHGHGHGHGARP